jgi:hypothetical protein
MTKKSKSVLGGRPEMLCRERGYASLRQVPTNFCQQLSWAVRLWDFGDR